MTTSDPLFLQLRVRVVEPTLAFLGLDDPAAVELVLGTAAQESGAKFLAQYPTGPARGFWQIEPGSHHDLLDNFVAFHPEIKSRLDQLVYAAMDRDQQLCTNLAYGAAICRLLYRRAPRPLPAATDLAGLGAYWKEFYNTPLGAGKAEEWVANYRRLIGAPGA